MDELLSSIKEIQEGGKRIANWYLDHGYVLLAIQSAARARRYPEDRPHGQQYYVNHNPVYVLGRPEGVEAAEPPPRWESPQRESEEGK